MKEGLADEHHVNTRAENEEVNMTIALNVGDTLKDRASRGLYNTTSCNSDFLTNALVETIRQRFMTDRGHVMCTFIIEGIKNELHDDIEGSHTQ